MRFGPLLHDAIPDYFPELREVFDPLLISFQLGHVKPERELFEAVEETLGVAANEIVFIDDTQGHVSAAISLGWGAILYQSPRQLRGALVERMLVIEAAPPDVEPQGKGGIAE